MKSFGYKIRHGAGDEPTAEGAIAANISLLNKRYPPSEINPIPRSPIANKAEIKSGISKENKHTAAAIKKRFTEQTIEAPIYPRLTSLV
ncbi:MAG: hypothetical protein GY834_02730, partial [Bacteroidetes bacterium]|nr:hypothetical protein [Bacteroidota bacterium]